MSARFNENKSNDSNVLPPCSGMVDRNKATVEDSTDTEKVDRNKATVEDAIGACASSDHVIDHQPTGSGMVDRRQSTVDYSTGNLVDMDAVDCHKKIVEDIEQTGLGIVVDRNKTTVEDPCENGVAAIVDRNKATIEDSAVDHEKSKVEDSIGTSSNHADCEHEPRVATPCPSGSEVVDSSLLSTSTDHVVDRAKSTFEDTQSVSNLVDRQKKTVEDHTSQDTDVNNHVVQPNHLVEQFKDHCNINYPGSEEPNSTPTAEKWKVHLYVDITSGQNIMAHLPTSGQSFEWDKPVLFGRGDNVDIFINDDHTSRDHVQLIGQILPNGQVLFMTRNVSTSQGYSVNGEYITDNEKWIPLKRGDKIKIAGLVLTVDIIPASIMPNFVLEFKLPQIHLSPILTTSPSTMYPVMAAYPFAGPYNLCPVAGCHPGHFVQHGSFPNNGLPHLPVNNGTYMCPHWPSAFGMPCDSTRVSNDMVERLLQQYQGREGYIKFKKLRYLAKEAVGEWLELGRALELEDWQLTSIGLDHPKHAEKSYQMLKTWVWLNPEKATLECLKTALEDVTVDRADLARKYCTENDDGENVLDRLDSTNDDDSNLVESP